jgi:uncharacterized protein (TIRG00374 family)
VHELPEFEKPTGGLARARQRLSSSPRLATLLKVGFTAVLLAIVLRSVDLPAAWRYTSEQSDWFLLLAAAFSIFQIVCGANRWHFILRRLNAAMPILESIRIYYISVFFSMCMLASIGGDVARIWLTYKNNIRVTTATISVILDRIAALAGVAIIVLAVSPFFTGLVGRDYVALAMILPALAAIGLLGIVVVAQLDRIPIGRWARFRLVNQLAALGGATRQIFLRPQTAIPVLVLGVASQVGGSLAAFAITRSLGLNVSAIDCLILMQPVTLLATLPISIGGWGVREAAMVTFFGLIGVPSSAAVIVSIQIGLLAVVLSLPGGILFLLQRSRAAKKAMES